MPGTLSTRVEQLDVTTRTKTLDNVTIVLKTSVQFRVLNEQINDDGRTRRASHSNPLEQHMVRTGSGTANSENFLNSGPPDARENHGVHRAFYRLTDIRKQLLPFVEDVVRSEVPRKSLDEAYESKESVALAIKQALQFEMRQYGYEVVNALVVDLQPDMAVMNAMNQIEAARRTRMATQEQVRAAPTARSAPLVCARVSVSVPVAD